MCSRKFLNFFCLCSMCRKTASDANNNNFPIVLQTNEWSFGAVGNKENMLYFQPKWSNPGFQKKKIHNKNAISIPYMDYFQWQM